MRSIPMARRRQWMLPIVVPAALAAALVIAFAVQSIRAVQMHRRVVANTLNDYSAFATWQYTRRASDYLRLVLTATFPFARATGGGVLGSDACRASDAGKRRACAYPLATEGFATCETTRGSIVIRRNETAFPAEALARALDPVLVSAAHQVLTLGIRPL